MTRKAAVIGAPENLLPTWMASEGTGRPHIERDGRAYCYVVQERGQEWARRRTQSEDEILWWIFEGVTHSMASDWEVAHRRPDEDSRRGLFKKQIELLEQLDPVWASRFDGRALPPIAQVIADVDVRQLDQGDVAVNMEPPNRRGIWFPMGYQ